MTSLKACSLFLLVLLLAVASAPLVAQDSVYYVQSGDSAWRIAGDVFDNPLLWRKVVEKNPFLAEKNRITVNPANGWTYVMMHPGEKLIGLTELGIIPDKVEISDLGIKIPEPIRIVTNEVPGWTWWVLIIGLLLFIVAWLIYWMLTRDPVNSRQAMVDGGVTEETASTAIQQVAARAAGYTREQSLGAYVHQQFTITRQTAGRIWGNMTVRYADGRSVPRRLSGEHAYQAEVRFPDGHTETLYMLQGCGNDLRYGGISRYLPGPEFRFEADPVPTATPTPAPQPAVQPEPTPTPEPVAQTDPSPKPSPAPKLTTAPLINQYGELVRTTDAPTNGHEDLLKISFRPEEGGKDSLVQAEGVDVERFTFEKNGSSITFRFREAKK